MYIPAAFRVEDCALIRDVVRAHPFAILVSTVDEEPFATHLPFLLAEENGRDVLYGHVAKANPNWQAFGNRALAIFAGPHGYVSPSWYETRPNVPTWNYVAVHAYGTPEALENPDVSAAHLREMVVAFDPHLGETNPESTSDETLRRLAPGVVAFRMPVDRWEGKTKLNQNRAEADRLAVRARYVGSDRPDEQAMARLMHG
jgi:transcriptional regulator